MCPTTSLVSFTAPVIVPEVSNEVEVSTEDESDIGEPEVTTGVETEAPVTEPNSSAGTEAPVTATSSIKGR